MPKDGNEVVGGRVLPSEDRGEGAITAIALRKGGRPRTEFMLPGRRSSRALPTGASKRGLRRGEMPEAPT